MLQRILSNSGNHVLLLTKVNPFPGSVYIVNFLDSLPHVLLRVVKLSWIFLYIFVIGFDYCKDAPRKGFSCISSDIRDMAAMVRIYFHTYDGSMLCQCMSTVLG